MPRSYNRARREGNVTRAIALYDEVQRHHPDSAESSAADVSLGLLRARTGALESAARHFERYLARTPGGSLRPEALWGLAAAYSKAGRTVEAREIWSELLEHHANSAYAGAARRRLRAGEDNE